MQPLRPAWRYLAGPEEIGIRQISPSFSYLDELRPQGSENFPGKGRCCIWPFKAEHQQDRFGEPSAFIALLIAAPAAMLILLLAFLAGVVAGLRSMTPLAVVSWAAYIGRLRVANTWLGFLGFAATPYVLSAFAAGELVADKLPKTPSRKMPAPFAARVISGALSGAAVGHSGRSLVGGALAGAIGGVVGTLGGYEFRARLARATGRDLTAALIEDALALFIAALIVAGIR